MLSTLAGCISASRRLRIKRGWYAPAVLWTASVVDSGQQKSPAQSVVTRLLYERQGRDLAEHVEQMNEYQKKLANYERDLNDWKRIKGPNGDAPEKPAEPICKRIMISDTTIEAVADRLQENPRGLLLDRDELSGWLGSYDQYRAGKGSDVSHWLSCYSRHAHGRDRPVHRLVRRGPVPGRRGRRRPDHRPVHWPQGSAWPDRDRGAGGGGVYCSGRLRQPIA